MKTAIIHDWLVSTGGAERCLEVFCELFPEATIFTLVHDPGKIDSDIINRMDIRTSFIQRLPLGKKKYRHYLPLMPRAIGAFNLSGYDLALSSSHCVAKGVRTPKATCHISYCYTPMRYIWNMYDEYFRSNRTGLAARLLMPLFLDRLRKWDVNTSKGVDYFIAISDNVRQRIKMYYDRESDVIYPPVNTGYFRNTGRRREDFFLAVSRFVPYKQLDLAVRAFNALKLPLVIIGGGPELNKLKKMAKDNIKILINQPDSSLRDYYSRCKALVFPANEDFGIIPIEAQSCGCPVIAYKKGGALETVVEGVTGKFFHSQTVEALVKTVEEFRPEEFSPDVIRNHAIKFDRNAFKVNIKKYIFEKYEDYKRTCKELN